MNPLQLLNEARTVCRELLVILTEENAGMSKHDVSFIEARLQAKKRLTLHLEQLLRQIKEKAPLWQSDKQAQIASFHLAEEIKHFQDLARTNAQMLKAAHQIRADLLITIRGAVEASTPSAKLYTSSGYMTTTGAETRLVARDI